jgi:hypothetical protein
MTGELGRLQALDVPLHQGHRQGMLAHGDHRGGFELSEPLDREPHGAELMLQPFDLLDAGHRLGVASAPEVGPGRHGDRGHVPGCSRVAANLLKRPAEPLERVGDAR